MTTTSMPTLVQTPTDSTHLKKRGGMMSRFSRSLSQSSSIHGWPGLSGQMLHDLTSSGGVAPGIVESVLVASISFLTQGLAYVACPNGQKLTIGANVHLLAPSWSGKSSILKILMEPVEQYLAMRQANGESLPAGLLMAGDMTGKALVRSLHGCPSAGYFTDAPRQFKKLLKDDYILSKVRTGMQAPYAQDSGKRIAPCLTMFVTDEPDVFDAKMLRDASKKGGAGILGHVFLAHLPNPRVKGPLHRVNLSPETKLVYGQRAHDLLDSTIQQIEQQKTQECPTLLFDTEAGAYLDHTDHEARRRCTSGGQWASIPEYAMGHVERVLRLAAAIHVFEHGTEGEITLDSLQCADAIGQWFATSFTQAIYEPPKLTQAEMDAAILEKAFIDLYYASSCCVQFFKSDIQAHALGFGLTPARFNRALAVLGEQGKIRTFSYQNKPCIEFLTMPEFSRTPYYLL